jgi:serine/tyrosine/threonine adenylyltransferase
MKQYKADYTNTFRALTREAHEESVLQGTSEFNDWYKRWQERLSRQEQSKEAALELMRKNNPSIIPRNHRVEEALDAAQQDDYSVMDKLLEALANPYDYTSVQEEYCQLPDSTGLPYRTYCGT